jgi:ribosomal-protein-alanine N-acetyltransferase
LSLKNSEIRKANAEDITDIFEIEQRAFAGPTAYTKRHLEYLVLRAGSTSLVETCGNKIRGFIIITYEWGSLTGNVETIDTDPAFHGQGIGLRLLMAAETEMRMRGKKFAQLEVSEKNEPAIRLYKKAGYIVTEKLERYYEHEHHGTRNALRMMKALAESP